MPDDARVLRRGKRRTPPRVVVDGLDVRLATAQRATVAVAVVLAAVVVWPPMPDPFMLPKLTVVILAAIVLLGLATVRAVRSARAAVPVGTVSAVVAVFAAFLVLATLTADNVALAAVGQHSRYSGLLSYGSYLVVFLVAVRVFASGSARGLLRAVLAASAAVTAYGLLQVAGLDPWDWRASRGDEPIFSTMGNTNFSGAYVALGLPVAVAVALLSEWPRAWRVGAAVLAVMSAAYMAVTGAAQGPISAAAGLAVVGVAWYLARRRGVAAGGRRGWSTGTRAALVVGALVAVAVGGVLVLRLAADVADSYTERLQFWQTAIRLFADHPLLGTGLDSFRDYFPYYRPGEHAALRGMQATDSTHNVPLGMLAAGGLGLGLAYLAFVGCTGWTLLRGLRTVAADRLLPVAAFGGMWVAFQVQSLVSVDVPALSLLHFVAAALVYATVAPPRMKALPLPFPRAASGGLLPGPQGRGRALAAGALAVATAVAVAATWMGTRPLRADLASAQARGQSSQVAARAHARAVEIAPWEAEYRLLQANALSAAKRPEQSLAAVQAAARLRRGSAQLALAYARLTAASGDQATARRWVDIALARDPRNPVAFEQAAELLQAEGDRATAERYSAQAEELRRRYGRR